MIRYVSPSPAQLADIATSGFIEDALGESAEVGMAYAESIAPVDTGAYRSSFRVERGKGGVRIVNDDEGAAAIEFGSDDTPAFHVLSQAADHIEGN